MLNLLFSLMMTAATVMPADSVVHNEDSLRTDTLREVTIRAGKIYHLSEMEMSGTKNDIAAPPSLGGVLEQLSPGINDKMLHPFAFKQRKQERRRKRVLKNLEEYDRVKTFDEQLREAYEKQLKEDAAAAAAESEK